MRIVFMGTPDFAAVVLRRLVEDHWDIAAAYTQPDKPKNRGMKLVPTPVKEFALTAGIPVRQPESCRDEAVLEQLRVLEPDVIVVAAYGKLLPQALLDIPKLAIINVHSSLLPQYRGAAPINWAVLNGDDPMLATLRGTLSQRAVFVGGGEGLDYTAWDLNSDGAAHLDCRIKTPRSQFEAEIPALGRHMIYPTLMAAAVGEALGMAPDEIVRGIGAFLPTKMRMNIVRCKGDIVILNDAYNANPQSMRAAAAVLGDAQGRRKVAVVGDMKELGPGSEQFHRAVGGYFAQSGADRLIAIGELARFMAEGAQEAGLAQALDCFRSGGDWDYLRAQAALALENRAEIRRWCGWRLGGRVCAFYQYVLDQDPGPLRRWDRVYRCYDTLRDAKSRLLYRR